MWEKFAAAQPLWTKYCVVAAYSLDLESELEATILMQTRNFIRQFDREHGRLLEAGLSSQLQKVMDKFAKRLVKWQRDMEDKIHDRFATELPDPWIQLRNNRSAKELIKDISLVVSFAHKIARQLDFSDDSRSIASSGVSRVESLASSEASCLSAQGGHHCFVPKHLFHRLLWDDEPSSAVPIQAKDLKKGTRILAADGTPTEVLRVEAQITKKLVELEIENAEPFITTPQHRIVAADAGSGTVKDVMAMELQVGMQVMCSDRTAKTVIGKRERLVQAQDVLAITFHGDKAVTCWLPPEQAVVLSKGLTRKPVRRSGTDRNVRPRRHEGDAVSIPDTAPGEYED
eukprot:s5014_g4.t1